jgi:hypothetical protein
MKWKVSLTVLFASIAILVSQSRLSEFLLEEAFSSLLVIAAVLILLWLFSVTFVVFWHGACFALFLLRAIGRWVTGVRNGPVGSEKAISHLPLRH